MPTVSSQILAELVNIRELLNASATPPPPSDYLTADEAAAVAGNISKRHFLNQVAAGKLPAGFRIGRNVRWHRPALVEALNAKGAK